MTISSAKTAPVILKKKSKPLLPITLAVLPLLLLGVTSFLLYQNLNLKKTQTKETSVPIPTLSPPSSSPSLLPTVDPSADWKTHSSSTYEIKYPTDFTFHLAEASTAILQKWGPTQKEGTELYDGISLSFEPREISTTLTNFTNSLIKGIEDQGMVEITEDPKSISLNNYQGLTFTEEGLGTFQHIILEKGSDSAFIHITFSISDPGNQGFEQIKNQILSTFKFTNRPNPNENNYLNSQLGFSLKIPSSWSNFYKVELSPKTAIFNFQTAGISYQLFTIHKVSLSEWETLKSEENTIFYGKELERDADKVFYFTQSLDNPLSGSEGDRYQDMSANINEIVSSFNIYR